MNTFQQTTKSGKPMITKQSKLPVFHMSVHARIKALCEQLDIPVLITKQGVKPQYSHEQRWDMIKQSMPQLI